MGSQVDVIETTEPGDRSYDGESAVVVDPQRDLDRIEAVLADQGLTCLLVLETHIHNDYVTGGLALARRCGARYVVAAADDVALSSAAGRCSPAAWDAPTSSTRPAPRNWPAPSSTA